MNTQLGFLEDAPTRAPSAHRDLTPESPLYRAVDGFREHMATNGLSPHTIRSFASDLNLFSRHLGSRRVLGGISTADLEGFLRYLREEREVPCNLKSLARRVTTLKVFFSWLVDAKALVHNPAAALVHRRPASPLPQVLAVSAVQRLLDAAESARRASPKADARPLLLISLVLSTGIKKGECMSLALSDLQLTDPDSPSVYIHYESARLRFKERRIRLQPEFVTVFAEYAEQYQPRRRVFECTARNLEYVLAEFSKRAGLPQHSVSFESLRWTCAMHDLRSGMDPDALRRKLGLSDITWTATYEKLQRLMAPAL